jgi:LacI family transcriptional regulator
VPRVGIRDVALRAGVSVGTVSNVINGLPSVAAIYVERVNRAIEDLGFVANESARQLKGGRSSTIGLVVMSAGNEFFTEFAAQADLAAEERGLHILLASSAQREERQRDYLNLFEEQRNRGILIAPLGSIPPYLSAMHRRGMPMVILGDHAPDESFCSVGLDTEASGYLAVRHLLDSGRRRLALVGGPAAQIEDRIRGARRAVAEVSGARLELIDTDDLTLAEGTRVAEMLGRRDLADRPDGIFCANDMVAIGMVNRLVRMEHVRVPEDIAIVGHDDIDFASAAAVTITTLRQPLPDLTGAAIQLLEEEVENGVEHMHSRIRIAPELVRRESAP